MAKTVTKKDLVDAVSAKAGIPRAKARLALDGMFEEISEQFKKGNTVRLTGLGTLEVRSEETRRIGKAVTSNRLKMSPVPENTKSYARKILKPASRGRFDLQELTEIAKKASEAQGRV